MAEGEAVLRLLACHNCQTVDPVPWCGEDPQCHHPLCCDTLNARLEPHYFESGQSHLLSLGVVKESDWATERGKQEALKQIKAAKGGHGEPVLGQKLYDVGKNYEAEAGACYSQHGRPGRLPGSSCDDYMHSKKLLLPDTSADRKELGLSTRQAARANTGTHLCQFCPYQSIVMQRVRKGQGHYDFKG